VNRNRESESYTMSRSSPSNGQRGQTEPLAALVAVSALIVGIGLYGLYLTDTLPGTTDRRPKRRQ